MSFPESSWHSYLNSHLTVITGSGKGSGKTTALRAALSGLRVAGAAGSVGVFTIGFDNSSTKSFDIRVNQGDVVITTVPLARSAGASLELIETLPGRSAIGQLFIGRVIRAGNVTLVGPEHFSQLAWAIALVRNDNLVHSVLVDGAAGRVTQAAALPDAQFLYCAKADASNYTRMAANLEMVAKLADMPVDDALPMDNPQSNKPSLEAKIAAYTDGHGQNVFRVNGPLTEPIIESIPKDITHISIETFCDCFLGASAFNRVSQHYKILLRKRIPLLGFAVALRNVSRDIFLKTAPVLSSKMVFNPLITENS